jgi:hypothetical protein
MRKGFDKIFSALFVLVFLFIIIASVSTDASATTYNIKQVVSHFYGTAGETLTTGNVVMIKDADGYAYKANASDSTLRPAVGIVGKGGNTGQTVEIITIGVLSGWSSLAEGGTGFLATSAGAVTQTEPAYAQKIASAISTTAYMFNFAAHPAVGYYNAGTGTASANTNKRSSGLFYSGSITITGGTSAVVAGLSPPFTSTSTYNCLVAPVVVAGTSIPFFCAKTSSASITVSTPTSTTATVDYIIVGY